MPDSRLAASSSLILEEIAAYHEDVIASLHLYFSSEAPAFIGRYLGQSSGQIKVALNERVRESDLRSSFALLTSLEASFRIDFEVRCQRRLKDDLSGYFREIRKTRGERVRLDEDILEGWKLHSTAPDALINQLRGAFKFRNWLAHGRYWTPKLGRQYSFDYLYDLALGVTSGFRFES